MADPRALSERRARLRDAGLRATAPRLAVLQVIEGSHSPQSHAEVAAELASAGFDRATIYRNLVDLTEVGLLRRTDLGDHIWRFESATHQHDHSGTHPHFVCASCGAVECLPSATVTLPTSGKGPKALRSGSVDVHLRGLCDSCI